MNKRLIKSEILFEGYYGRQNTGDDAFVEVASWGAEYYWEKKSNIFLGKKNNLPITKKKINGYPFAIPKTYNFQNRILLSSTNYLISAGGSIFHSELKTNNIKNLAVEKKRQGSRIKIGGIGVSIGPFKTTKDEKAIFDYLNNIDFLAVRDQASFDIAESLDLPYQPVNAFDLAALLPKIYFEEEKDKSSTNRKKVVGVSVCPYESIADKAKIKRELTRNIKISNLLRLLAQQENIHFKFFVINGHNKLGDLELTRKTIEEVSPKSYEIIPYCRNTKVIWDEISCCDFMISTRLHAAIFSCFSNTPFVLHEYHRKCGDFLDNIGYDKTLRIFDAEYCEIEKAKKIIEILNDKSNYFFPTRTNEMKELAELNFTGIDI